MVDFGSLDFKEYTGQKGNAGEVGLVKYGFTQRLCFFSASVANVIKHKTLLSLISKIGFVEKEVDRLYACDIEIYFDIDREKILSFKT